MMEIDKVASKYNKYSLWIIVIITLAGLFFAQVAVRDYLYNIIIFNAIYALLLRSLYIMIWKRMARKDPQKLTNFYLGASTARLLLTLVVAVVGILVMQKEKYQLVAFLVDLAVYYLAVLVFDSTFFCLYEKNHKNKD